jgi:hypothetical protein
MVRTRQLNRRPLYWLLIFNQSTTNKMTCNVYYDDIGMSYEEIVAMLPPNTTINIKKYHLI